MTSVMPRNISNVISLHPPSASEVVSFWSKGSNDPALAEAMAAVESELASDGLLLMWHENDQSPRALFGSGACEQQSDNERDMIYSANVNSDTDSHILPARWMLAEQQASGATLTTRIAAGAGTAVIVAFYWRAGDALRSKLNERSTRLLPMVRAFLRIWADRESTAARLRGMTAALDHSDVATILLDKRGSVGFVNAAAQSLISSQDGLRRTGTTLSATRLADTLRLQAAIEHVNNVDGDDRDSDSSVVVALHRKVGRPLLAAVTPVTGAPVGNETAAMVTLHDPSQLKDTMLVPACKMYGLTPVETRLACLLATGASLMECATKMRVQEQTVRSYLKQLFGKTDTNRQGELIALLLSSAVRLMPGLKTGFI